ncbi:hypothetical protein GmHk_03G006792 [Glycine max]|nr:hypothetical protein GmHk_03G006792 [Glycine max]
MCARMCSSGNNITLYHFVIDEDCKIVSRIRQRSSWTWMDSSISISSSVRNLRNLEHLSFIMTARRNSKFIVSSKSVRWPYS